MGSLVRQFFIKVWNSPVLMTWASFASRSLGLVLVLPLMVTSLATADIALLMLFQTVTSLRLLTDLGFTPTFTRLTAFALGGANAAELEDMRRPGPRSDAARKPKWETLARICEASRRIYFWLSLLSFALIATLGSLTIARLANASTDPMAGWLAWACIVIVTPFALFANRYRSFLQGTDHIAVLRRWEAILGLLGISASFFILLIGGSVLALTLSGQLIAVGTFLVIRHLARQRDNTHALTSTATTMPTEVWNAAWPSSWRSGVTVLMSYGLTLGSGAMYAQFGELAVVASYLMALQFSTAISDFSRAPFYTKIPRLARLHAQGEQQQQIALAQRAMLLSYITFVLPFVILGIVGNWGFEMIGSNVPFPEPVLWSLLGLSFYFERYGAMHIQLYSTTNHIVTHIMNGITGGIWIVAILLLLPHFGVYSLPLGFLIGNLGFYAWFGAHYSYAAYKMDFWRFELFTSFGPLLMLIAYCAYFILQH